MGCFLNICSKKKVTKCSSVLLLRLVTFFSEQTYNHLQRNWHNLEMHSITYFKNNCSPKSKSTSNFLFITWLKILGPSGCYQMRCAPLRDFTIHLINLSIFLFDNFDREMPELLCNFLIGYYFNTISRISTANRLCIWHLL